MLFHLIYVSTATESMSGNDLSQLLSQSRTNNEANRITGMLLYRNGHFMQVLEGEEAKVLEAFARIERDSRHKKTDVLRAELIQHRDFPDWTMGFKDMSAIDPATAPAFTRFLDSDFKPEYFAETHVEAHAMLLAMKKSCDN